MTQRKVASACGSHVLLTLLLTDGDSPGGATGGCSTGYEGTVCGTCTDAYYRSSGRCLECPQSSLAMLIGLSAVIAVALVVIVIVAWKFAKAKGSKAWASIGVNFFQVCCMSNAVLPCSLLALTHSHSRAGGGCSV